MAHHGSAPDNGSSLAPDTRLPRAHFPMLLCPHSIRHELLIDYGSCQNVCLTCKEEGSGLQVVAQKDHWNRQRPVMRASMPAIPLIPVNNGKCEKQEQVLMHSCGFLTFYEPISFDFAWQL